MSRVKLRVFFIVYSLTSGQSRHFLCIYLYMQYKLPDFGLKRNKMAYTSMLVRDNS